MSTRDAHRSWDSVIEHLGPYTSPGNLTRLGWSEHSLNPGDRVAIDLSPFRDGRHGGSLKKATVLNTARVLTTAPAAAVSSAAKWAIGHGMDRPISPG
jgi:hypothetical protein